MKKKIFLLLIITSLCITLPAYTALDKNNVNSFDRVFMKEYNSSLDKASTLVDIAVFTTPLITAFSGEKRLGTTVVMYAESFLLGWGAKELLKYAVNRERPYLYYDNPPENKKDDWSKSFPSGHTTMAFLTASFVSYTFCKYNRESNWKIPVSLSVFSLATLEAALRIMSGSHFMTDVLCGAALGTLIGFAVPYFHTLGENVEVSGTPFSLIFNLSF